MFKRSCFPGIRFLWTQPGITVSFTLGNGRASGLEVLLDDGSAVARAERVR